MKQLWIIMSLLFLFFSGKQKIVAQSSKYEVNQSWSTVWSSGLFKSWLKDEYLDFNVINNNISPIYQEQYKMGFSIQSHYLYNLFPNLSIGPHLGIGIDVNSYIQAPVVLFGGSLGIGKNNDFLISFGWSDGKKRNISDNLLETLENINLTEVPIIAERTNLNTAFYLGLSYRFY